MSFSIYRLNENGLDLVVLKDEKTGTAVSVLPRFGALLHAFRVRLDNDFFNIIENYNSLEQAKKELETSFKSSKLSPFACRIPQGKYKVNGVEYELKNKFIDGSAIHGLLYNKPFDILQESADNEMASVALQYQYKKDDEGYPFDYSCKVQYALQHDNLLQIRTTVSNDNGTPIPVADGWHPYFRLGGNIDDWLIHFNAEAIVEFDDELIPTGRLLKYDLFNKPRRIGQTELDNCFMVNIEKDYAACEVFNPENKLKVSFFPESSYPYLQIYTPPHRKSIAIENLSAAPDSFNNKMGLLVLQPGHSQTFTVYYQVSVV